LAQGEADAAAPKTRASKDWNGDVAPSPKAKLSKVPLVSGVLNSESLAKSTVPVLKDMLRERGMKVSGSKSELIARLLQ